MSSVQLNFQNRKLTLSDVHEIVKETIISSRDDNHDPNTSEYFLMILSFLSSGNVEKRHLHYFLILLDGILHHCPVELVRSQFLNSSRVLLEILSIANETKRNNNDNNDNDNNYNNNMNLIIINCLEALGKLIYNQEMSDAFWNSVGALQVINTFLTFLEDDNIKIKNIANKKLLLIIKYHKDSNIYHLNNYIAEYCLQIIKRATRENYKRCLSIVEFVKNIIVYFKEFYIIKIWNLLFQIINSCNQPILSIASLKALNTSFQNSDLSISKNNLIDTVKNIINYNPDNIYSTDMETHIYYYLLLASSTYHLKDITTQEQEITIMYMKSLQILIQGYHSDFIQIHVAVTSSIKHIVSFILLKNFPENIYNCVLLLEELLDISYQNAWLYIIDVIRNIMISINNFIIKNENTDLYESCIISILNKLSYIYQNIENNEINVTPDVEISFRDAIGDSLNILSLNKFLEIVPLAKTTIASFGGIDNDREWIISVLKNQFKYINCSLSDIQSLILRSQNCEKHFLKKGFQAVSTTNKIILKRSIELFWSLLPEFFISSLPYDFDVEFQYLLPLLLEKLEKYFIIDNMNILKDNDLDNREIIFYIINGLTNITKTIDININIIIQRKSSQEIIPLLLNCIEKISISSDFFRPMVELIGNWSKMADGTLIINISKKLIQLILSQNSINQNKTSQESENTSRWLSVMLIILPYLPNTMLNILYRTIKPLLSLSITAPLQKRAYLVFEALIKEHSHVLLNNLDSFSSVLESLVNSILVCHISSRNLRLRCISNLIKKIEDENMHTACQLVLGEVLLCLKEANKKCRETAVDIIKVLSRRCSSEFMYTFLNTIILPQNSNNEKISGILGLSILYRAKKYDINLVNSSINLVHIITSNNINPQNNIELARSILKLIRTLISVVSIDDLKINLSLFIKAFLNHGNIDKSKLQKRIQGILRKLCTRVINDNEAIMMIKEIISVRDFPMLNNILKTARKASRLKSNNNSNGMNIHVDGYNNIDDDDDSDVDSFSNENESHTTMTTDVLLQDDLEMNNNDKMSGKGLTASSLNANIYKHISMMEQEEVEDVYTNDEIKVKPLRVNEIISTRPSTLDDLIGDDDDLLKSSNIHSESNHDMNTIINPVSMNMNSAVKVDHSGRIYIVDENDDDVETNAATVEPEDTDDNNYGSFNNKNRQISKDGIGLDGVLSSKHNSSSSSHSHKTKLPGEEYKSKNSAGDVWKKGMLQPHAYIPLDGKLFGKKKSIRKETLNQYTSVLATSKKKRGDIKPAKSSDNRFGKKKTTLSRKQRVARKLKG